MPRESNKAHLPLFLSGQQRLGCSIRSKDQVRVVVIHNFMDLPQVQMIGLQAPQRLFQLIHGDVFTASVRAHLRHHKRLVAFTFQCHSQAFFAHAVMVFPAVIEKIDPRIQRSRNQLRRFLVFFDRSKVITADSQARNQRTRFPQGPLRDSLRIRSLAVSALCRRPPYHEGSCHCRGASFDKAAPRETFLSVHYALLNLWLRWPYIWKGASYISVAFNISFTSVLCWSSGKSCAIRACGLSNFSDTL